jgi:hypothetical protein
MVPVVQLWLPIVLSAVFVFIASFLAWMVLPHHKKDVKRLPDEAAFARQLEQMNLPPGTYMWPQACTAEEMKSDEFKQRYAKGPWGSLNVLGKQPNFGMNLVLVLICYLVLGLFVAYITGLTLAAGAEYLTVFRIAGATAVLGYCFGSIPNAIFFGKPLRFVITDLADNLVYGLVTAGTFAWLWPSAG